MSMVPPSRRYFLMNSFAPWISRISQSYHILTASELTKQALEDKDVMFDSNPEESQFKTMSVIFRGPLPKQEIHKWKTDIQVSNSVSFASRMPNDIVTNACDIPVYGLKASATLIGKVLYLLKSNSHDHKSALFH